MQSNAPINATLMELPILKHFNQNEIVSTNKLNGGQNSIYNILRLAVFAGIGFGIWKYVLPQIFQALGQMLALTITGVMCVFLVLAAPAIFKGLKTLARKLHKLAINSDPFAELERQRQKMLNNKQIFTISEAKIKALRNDMEVEANKSEKEAQDSQTKILTIQSKANKLKTDLEDMVAKDGLEARNSDEYVNGNAELVKLLSDGARWSNKLAQSKDFIQKYGSRAAIMKKFGQKLVMVGTSMDIKIADFDATIEMLKKDFEFGQKSRMATDAAKSAMLFTKSWELDYALDVVTNTIASDIALTASNMKDIDTLTSQYSMDSDELYTNLNTLADKIKVGSETVPNAKQYSNPDYQLTQSDKLKSGGFQDLF